MNRYREYFDGVKPVTNDSEFAASVIKASRGGRISRKTFITAFSAAAAVMALTVTASAVYNWDIGAAVRAFFKDRNNIAQESIADVNVISAENTFENLDISVKGAYSSSLLTVVFFDIARTDGGIFDCAPYTLLTAEGEPLIMSDGNECVEKPQFWFDSQRAEIECFSDEFPDAFYREYALRCGAVSDGNDSDERLTLAVCIDTYDPFSGYAPEPSGSKKVRLYFSGLTGRKCTGAYSGKSIILNGYNAFSGTGSFSCELELSGRGADTLTFSGGKETAAAVYTNSSVPDDIRFKTHTFTAEEITLTPVSLSVRLEGERPEETCYLDGSRLGKIIMNDGREIKFGEYTLPSIVRENGNIKGISSDNGKWNITASFILPETIDINEVSKVIIGDTEFTF